MGKKNRCIIGDSSRQHKLTQNDITQCSPKGINLERYIGDITLSEKPLLFHSHLCSSKMGIGNRNA